eukprot:scpid16915/ scgid3745/ 
MSPASHECPGTAHSPVCCPVASAFSIPGQYSPALQLDYRVAVPCLPRTGSRSSPTLDRIAATLWEWCQSAQRYHFDSQYLPGAVNTVADYHSRHHTDTGAWMLNRSVFQVHQIM